MHSNVAFLFAPWRVYNYRLSNGVMIQYYLQRSVAHDMPRHLAPPIHNTRDSSARKNYECASPKSMSTNSTSFHYFVIDTGSQNGLQLTLNVEEYENIVGYGDNNGVMVNITCV